MHNIVIFSLNFPTDMLSLLQAATTNMQENPSQESMMPCLISKAKLINMKPGKKWRGRFPLQPSLCRQQQEHWRKWHKMIETSHSRVWHAELSGCCSGPVSPIESPASQTTWWVSRAVCVRELLSWELLHLWYQKNHSFVNSPAWKQIWLWGEVGRGGGRDVRDLPTLRTQCFGCTVLDVQLQKPIICQANFVHSSDQQHTFWQKKCSTQLAHFFGICPFLY